MGTSIKRARKFAVGTSMATTGAIKNQQFFASV